MPTPKYPLNAERSYYSQLKNAIGFFFSQIKENVLGAYQYMTVQSFDPTFMFDEFNKTWELLSLKLTETVKKAIDQVVTVVQSNTESFYQYASEKELKKKTLI